MNVNSHESQRFALRLALFYATLFAGFGVYMPFFPVWLQSKGLTDGQIGILLAAVTITRIVVTPLVARLADRSSSIKTLIVVCAIGASAILPILVVVDGFWAVGFVLVLSCVFWGPLTPLSDTYGVAGIALRNLDYGRIRAWGSISFLVAALLAGLIKTQIAVENLIWVQWGTLMLSVFGAALLVADRRAEPEPLSAGIQPPSFANWRFIAVIMVGAIIQCSHAVQYSFSSILWASQGYSGVVIGLLWSLGVLSEIILFLWGRRLIDRYDPLTLMACGGAAAVLRWCIAAYAPPLSVLLPLQLLHAGSFGVVHLATIAYLGQNVPARARAAGMAWMTVVVGGALAVATIMSGQLYALMQVHAYWVMGALALCGMLAAVALRKPQPQSEGTGG